MDSSTEQNLLFGLLALQNGLIQQGDLVGCFQAWTQDKSRSLGERLVEAGALDSRERELIAGLVAVHREKHAGGAGGSLSGLAGATITVDLLGKLGVGEDLSALTRTMTATAETRGDATLTYAVTGGGEAGLRYQPLRAHAQDGMGAIFVALDRELNREVALKEMLERLASDTAGRQRFFQEAEITGGLEHPGIVPVYGLGTYADGRPYYAMKFVRGQTLKEAIGAFHGSSEGERDPSVHSLEFRKLLRCVVDVCEAIHYAHGRKVLHRDIKPANVIVGKHGETFVVDWGLAKLLGGEEVSQSVEERPLRLSGQSGSMETMAGSVMGTPTYMSPEQARGEVESIGPESDVYSLGATLFAVLTGKASVEGENVAALLRAVREGKIRAPREVNPRLDRGLEAVCKKAMALRPEDRYATPRALADDLERWMADEPVSVHREAWTLRLARWRRRHRTLVTAMGLGLVAAVVALGVGAALIERERRHTEREYVRAEREYRRARETVDEYFTKVSEDDLLNVPGLQPLRKELLGSARAYYQQFIAERGEDPTLKADLAWTQARLGNVANALDQRGEAIDSYKKAVSLYEEVVEGAPASRKDQLSLAMALDRQALLLMDESGHLDEAEVLLVRSQELLTELVASEPEDVLVGSFLAGSYGNLASVFETRGDYERADTLRERLIEGRRKLYRDHPDDIKLLNDAALAEFQGAKYAHGVGREEEARSSYEAAVQLYERLTERDSEGAQPRLYLGLALASLGRWHFEVGEPEAGRQPLERGASILEKLVAENPLVGLYRAGLSSTLNMLSDLDRATGHLDEAGAHAAKASALLEALVREAPDSVLYVTSLAKASNVVGRVAAAHGDTEGAIKAFRRTVEILDGLPEVDPAERYNAACNEALIVGLLDGEERGAQVERAMSSIERAVAAGFANVEFYRRDTDFDAMREEPVFGRFLESLGE